MALDFVEILGIDPDVLIDAIRKSKERIGQLEKEGNVDELEQERKKFKIYSEALEVHFRNDL